MKFQLSIIFLFFGAASGFAGPVEVAVDGKAFTSRPNGTLPWTDYVNGQGNSNTEYSARYQAETDLRYRIDQKRYRCDRDKGYFSYSASTMSCHKTGSYSWTCNGSASCSCR